MGGADDRELVARAQSGDRAAANELLRRHYDRIYAICRRIAGNDADAADATQEALMAIVRGLDRFDGNAKFSTWSYRVATNACLDELRRRKRRPTPTDMDEHADWSTQTADVEAGDFDDRMVERDAMAQALAELADDFREPVVLRDVGGLDYAEISQQLGIPPGTVRSRIARGRAKLAEILAAGNQNASDERPSSRDPDQRPGTAP